VEVHRDSAAEATYLIPYKPERARKWHYSFLGFRFVRFSENSTVCINWCKDCPCGQECGLDRELEGQHRQHRCKDAYLGDGPHMCLLGQAFLQRLGGTARLRRQMQGATAVQHGDGRLCVSLPDLRISLPDLRNGSLSCMAARAGPRFRSWGAISSELYCATCDSKQRTCCHIGCLPSADREAAAAAAAKPMMQDSCMSSSSARVLTLTVAAAAGHACHGCRCPRTCAIRGRLPSSQSALRFWTSTQVRTTFIVMAAAP
jgi:hypothetical protein